MLPQYRRISKSVDWQRMHEKGTAIHSKCLVLRVLKNHQVKSRFGFIVGVRIDKRASRRNLIKRRLRDIIAKEIGYIREGNDVILIAKPAISHEDYQGLKDIVVKLLNKAKLLK